MEDLVVSMASTLRQLILNKVIAIHQCMSGSKVDAFISKSASSLLSYHIAGKFGEN